MLEIIISKKDCQLLKNETIERCRNEIVNQPLDVIKNYGFTITKEFDGFYWIKKDKFFPIDVVKDYLYLKGNGYQTVIKIVNNNSKFQKLNLGITSYKMRVTPIIDSVICEGEHPNCNPMNKKFCLPISLYLKSLNIKSLTEIEDCLTIINLNTSYYTGFGYEKKLNAIRRSIHERL